MKRTLLMSSALVVGLLAFASAGAEARTTLNLCTGKSGLPYAQIGDMIAMQLAGDGNVEIRVVKDTGGTWGNIVRTTQIENSAIPTQADYDSGAACHAFIGQPDGPALLARKNPGEAKKLSTVGALHREYLHVVCNKASDVDDLNDLPGTSGTIAVGNPGSGAWIIWENFIYEDNSYGTVPTNTLSGIDAISDVASGTTTCALVAAGLKNADMNEADELFGDEVVLAGANDKDFNDAVDIEGKALYEWREIPSGTYPLHLQGWFSAADTISWQAKVYVNSSRIADPKAKTALIRAVARVKAAVQKEYGN